MDLQLHDECTMRERAISDGGAACSVRADRIWGRWRAPTRK
jgi:hypothetical protein